MWLRQGRVPVVSRRGIALFDLGQSEVENLYLAGGRQEDVSRFDVAMENAFSMRRIQRVRDLHSEVQ